MIDTYWFVYVWGDIDPEMRGPFVTEEDRDAAAKAAKAEDGRDYREDSVFWLDIEDGKPVVGSYESEFFEEDEELSA